MTPLLIESSACPPRRRAPRAECRSPPRSPSNAVPRTPEAATRESSAAPVVRNAPYRARRVQRTTPASPRAHARQGVLQRPRRRPLLDGPNASLETVHVLRHLHAPARPERERHHLAQERLVLAEAYDLAAALMRHVAQRVAHLAIELRRRRRVELALRPVRHPIGVLVLDVQPIGDVDGADGAVVLFLEGAYELRELRNVLF